MPRDLSGNYTLPAGNPVVAATTIATTWANPTLADVAAQLNGVVTRDGLLAPTAPIKFLAGTAAAPGITFALDPALGFYRKAANVLGFASAGVERGELLADGRWRFQPPTGGAFGALTILNGTAANGAGIVVQLPAATETYGYYAGHASCLYAQGFTVGNAAYIGTTSFAAAPLEIRTFGIARLNITADGRIYGTGIHNNAGSMTGTTNQYIGSGTYTPTLASLSNVAASVPYLARWMRVGNVVTVSGQLDIDPTLANVITSLSITLPIASAITSGAELSGTAVRVSGGAGEAGVACAVYGDPATDTAVVNYNNDAVLTARVFTYHFTYLVA